MDSSVWNRFDFRGAVRYSGYADRNAVFDREMNRIGMTNLMEFWSSDCIYDQFIHAAIPKKKSVGKNPLALTITLHHLNMVKVALDMGAQTMLFMEDDIRFLKDVDKMSEIFLTLPKDFDVAMFDMFAAKKLRDDPTFLPRIESNRLADAPCWCRGGIDGFRSNGCYAFSRIGAYLYVEMLEGAARGVNKMHVCDQFLGSLMASTDIKTYIAMPRAAIQAAYPKSNSGAQNVIDGYNALGVDRSLYQSYPGEVEA